MENENTNVKKSKKKAIIISSIVAVIVIAIIVVIFLLTNKKDNVKAEDNDPNWLKTYITILEGKSIESPPSTCPNKEFQLINVNQSDIPALVLRYDYEFEGETSKNLSFIISDEEGKIEASLTSSGDCKLKLIYNKDQGKYEWFLFRDYHDDYVYQSLENFLINQINSKAEGYSSPEDDIEDTYWFFGPGKSSNDTTQKEFDSKYIDTNLDELANNWISYEYTDGEDVFKSELRNEESKNKLADNIITDDQKSTIATKVDEQDKVAQEEQAKKEAAEKAAAEEAAKTLKVGDCTLKYGKYVSDVSQMDNSMYGTITLNSDGTFHIKANCEGSYPYPTLDCDGTYKVELNQPTGYPDEYANYITFNPEDGESFSFEVYQNNSFSDQWHRYSYSEN